MRKKVLDMFRTGDGKLHLLTFLLVCGIFVCTGLCNGMIDSLNKHFQNSFAVSKAKSAFVQFFWYIAYFLLALPSGWYARRFGYKAGIITGLGLVVFGSLIVYPAAAINTFWAFMVVLFIIATGLTFLEAIANPYATVLGPPDYGVARINFAQTCNAVGWIIGPSVVGWFVLSGTAVANTSNSNLYIPYLIVAACVGLLALTFCFAPVPDLQPKDESIASADGQTSQRSLFTEWHFVLAIAAQFLYTAGQTGIFSFFINYVKECSPLIPQTFAGVVADHFPDGIIMDGRITDKGAATLLSLGGFSLFLLGRFIGSLILRVAKSHITLGIYASINVLLMIVIVGGKGNGWLAVGALLLSFFFMSIMYPTIFALGIRGLGARTKLAASFMVMAILGGALGPLIMGMMGERHMFAGFLMPLICFVGIMFYGFIWPRFYCRAGNSNKDGDV